MRRSIRKLGIVVGVGVLLLAIYMSAYLGMVGRGFDWRLQPDKDRLVEPDYGFQDEEGLIAILFEPIHAIDRRLRPDYWSGELIREAVAEHRDRPRRTSLFRWLGIQRVRE